MTLKQKIIAFLLAIVVALGGGYSAKHFGSVNNENGYYATTTDSTWSSPDGQKIIKRGGGLLGTIDMPVVTTGTLSLYDGTTTITHADYPTTTLAVFPASSVGGSHVLDINFTRGLLAVWSSTAGGVSSSTITWK